MLKNYLPGYDVEVWESGCYVWTGALDGRGYGQLGKARNGSRLAHRATYSHYVGDIPPGMCVCHTCDNKRCVRAEHLFVGTHQDNSDDMVAKGRGRGATGDKNVNCKLNADKVRAIRALRATGLSLQKVGDLYDIGPTTVRDICSFKTWRYVV